jgi:hypothetical protein
MTHLILVASLIFVVAITMTMVGKGGGNFYVVILALAAVPMHEAATTGQFILFTASVAAMLIFHKNKQISWPLALFIASLISISALAGGFFSPLLDAIILKWVFAGMLILAGVLMLIPTAEHRTTHRPGMGHWSLGTGDEKMIVNCWIAVPVIVMTGLGSGMVGVSGGSFLVPLMVLACGAPMQVAVGTASCLIAVTALMGFTGHALQGHFNPHWALPLAAVTILGGFIGGKFALKSRPKNLKKVFAITNGLAAAFMIINAIQGQ